MLFESGYKKNDFFSVNFSRCFPFPIFNFSESCLFIERKLLQPPRINYKQKFVNITGSLKNSAKKSPGSKAVKKWHFNDEILNPRYKKQVHFDDTAEIIIIPGRTQKQLWAAYCKNTAYAIKTVLSVLCLPCIALYQAIFNCVPKDSNTDDPHPSGQINRAATRFPKTSAL